MQCGAVHEGKLFLSFLPDGMGKLTTTSGNLLVLESKTTFQPASCEGRKRPGLLFRRKVRMAIVFAPRFLHANWRLEIADCGSFASPTSTFNTASTAFEATALFLQILLSIFNLSFSSSSSSRSHLLPAFERPSLEPQISLALPIPLDCVAQPTNSRPRQTGINL